MDFSVIFQLRNKKLWWMDVIFYFVISLLIATAFCYLIFSVKNGLLKGDIRKETMALQTVGTDQQKNYESEVIGYQKKISTFTELFQNHEFASNVFSFMQSQTMPNVWYEQFSLDEKNNTVQLSGESDSMDALSRQIAYLEKNKYVKDVGNLSSSLGENAKIKFSVNLTLDQKIFSYLSDISLLAIGATPSSQPLVKQNPTASTGNANANQQSGSLQNPQGQGSEKLITSFHLLLSPEVIGTIDATNYTISLNVPFGTDVKSLTPLIATSTGATVSPVSYSSQDFTNPITYIVTAQDGLTQNYKVTVNISPKTVEKSSQSGSTIIIIVLIVIIAVIIIAGILFLFLRKIKSRKENL